MFKNIGLVIKGNLSLKNSRVIEELVGLIKTKSRNVYLENSSTTSSIKGVKLISQLKQYCSSKILFSLLMMKEIHQSK